MINKIFNLLTLKLKVQLTFIIIIMFVKGLLEIISISSIPFLIFYLLSPQKIISFLEKNNLDFFSQIVVSLDLSSVLLIIVLTFILKNILFLLFNIYEENFHYKINVKFRADLLKHYLNLSYLDLIKNNLSTIIRNISIEVVHFSSAITNIIKILNDMVMISTFLIFLVFISSFQFLIVFAAFTSFSVLIYLILKKKLKNNGVKSVEGRGLYIKNITDIFLLIKDISLNNLQQYFYNLFEKNLKFTEKIDFFSKIVFSSTKLFFETFAVLLLCILIYINQGNNNNYDELLAYLSIVSLATIRMLPLFNSVLSESNKLQFRYGSVKIISEELNNIYSKNLNNFLINSRSDNEQSLTYKKNLTINNLSSNLLGKSILEKINLEIHKGNKIALIGRSGGGKTTFLNHISQLYEIPAKTIFSDREDVLEKKNYWQNLVSYMPQENHLINGTIVENIALGVEKDKLNKKNLEKALEFSFCNEFLDKLPDKKNTILGKDGFKLSGGQTQRVCIARSLYKDFEILLMDEPTSSLDRSLETKILDKIFKMYENKTIIISLHKLELIEKFEYLMILDQKKLFSFSKVTDIHKNKEIEMYIEKLKINEKQ
jgi:ATP-binding cassette subfamily C protein